MRELTESDRKRLVPKQQRLLVQMLEAVAGEDDDDVLTQEEQDFVAQKFRVVPDSQLIAAIESLFNLGCLHKKKKRAPLIEIDPKKALSFKLEMVLVFLQQVRLLRQRYKSTPYQIKIVRNIPPMVFLLTSFGYVSSIFLRWINTPTIAQDVSFTPINSGNITAPSFSANYSDNVSSSSEDDNQTHDMRPRTSHDPTLQEEESYGWIAMALCFFIFSILCYCCNTRVKRYSKPEPQALNKLIDSVNLLLSTNEKIDEDSNETLTEKLEYFLPTADRLSYMTKLDLVEDKLLELWDDYHDRAREQIQDNYTEKMNRVVLQDEDDDVVELPTLRNDVLWRTNLEEDERRDEERRELAKKHYEDVKRFLGISSSDFSSRFEII